MDHELKEEIEDLFAGQNTIVKGSHFAYTPKDGKWFHGYDYVSKELLCADPGSVEQLASIIALEFSKLNSHIDTAVGIAEGTIGLATLTSLMIEQLQSKKLKVCYAEKENAKDPNTAFIFRGVFEQFVIGKKVLILEDVLNSGGSAKRVVNAVKKLGGEVVAIFALCSRGKVTSEMVGGVPLFSLMEVDMEMFPAEDCPVCKEKGIESIRLDLGKGVDYLKSIGQVNV